MNGAGTSDDARWLSRTISAAINVPRGAPARDGELLSQRWFDLRLEVSPSGTHQQEEDKAIEIASQHLVSQGVEVQRGDCTVLHCREFHPIPEEPFKVARSKLFLVIVSERYLVSLHDGPSWAVDKVREQLGETSAVHALDVARLVAERSLESLAEVEVNFHRALGGLVRKVPRDGLNRDETYALYSLYEAVAYITRRLQLMESLVVHPAESLIRSGEYAAQQGHADFRALSVRLNSHIATCTQQLSFIHTIRDINVDFVRSQQLQEQRESNRLQALAEEHQRQKDARWQMLGGVSVPVGLALSAIDAFNLSAFDGLGVLGSALVIAGSLVYFRNARFSWLLDSRKDRSDSRKAPEVQSSFDQ
jgi:hypothetical protein